MKFQEEFESAAKYQEKHYSGNVAVTMEMALAMNLAGLSPRKIYAFCKTGLIVISRPDGTSNIDHRDRKDKKEWMACLIEFDNLTKGNA